MSAKSLFAALARSQNRRTASASPELVAVRITGRDAQRRHRDHPLARQPEALPARRQHRHLRATVLDRVDLARDRIEEMLTVVEHQQQPLGGEIVEHRLVERPTRQRLHPQARRQRLPHRLRIGDRRELAQPRTVRELADDFRRNLERETGLADPAHPGQRHQRRPTDQLRQRRELRLAPDERSSPDAAGSRGNASSVRNGGTPARRSGWATWNNRSGLPQVAQPVLSQVDEPVLLGERVVQHALPSRSDTTICPPCATDISRAARFTAPP